jgi:hypothetical protein
MPTVEEVLSAIQAQQETLESKMQLREALEESGLPADEKRKIRRQFAGQPFDADAVDEAIEDAHKRLKESAKAEPVVEESPALPAVRSPGYDYQKVGDRFNVFREGQLLGNFASKPEADAAVARDQRTREGNAQEAQRAADEKYAVQLKLVECKLLLKEKLQESGLPLTAQAKLEKQFAGQIFDERQLQEAIEDTWDMLSPLIGTGQINIIGQERGLRQAKIIEDETDRHAAAFDGFWAGENQKTPGGVIVPRFRSLQEAYEMITGKRYDPLIVMQELSPRHGHQYDSHGRYGEQAGRVTEAISTTSWAQAMGDSITRRVLAEYRLPELSQWRQLTSEISAPTDFRVQRRVRFGGYGTLPVVPEGISYTPLPTPTDQEAAGQLAKRGGLETITMEALSNDDLGLIRRIPQRLGRAAAQTLFRGFFDLLDQNAALTFDDDTTALFTSGHANNLPGNPLTPDGLDLAVQTLANQTAYNNATELLGLRPRFLVHPTALWRNAHKLVMTERGEPLTADNDANPFLQFAMVPVNVPYWTNANNWYLVADPRDIPTFEVGFWRGMQDPEIFVSDQENISGSAMFEADKITYKIRHVWMIMILDYRGIVRSTA